MKSEKIRIHLYRTATNIKQELIETQNLWPKILISLNPSTRSKNTYRDISDLSPAVLYAVHHLEKHIKKTKSEKRYYMWFLKRYWSLHQFLPEYLYMFKEDFSSFVECLEMGISVQFNIFESDAKFEQIEQFFWNNEIDLEHWKKTFNRKK